MSATTERSRFAPFVQLVTTKANPLFSQVLSGSDDDMNASSSPSHVTTQRMSVRALPQQLVVQTLEQERLSRAGVSPQTSEVPHTRGSGRNSVLSVPRGDSGGGKDSLRQSWESRSPLSAVAAEFSDLPVSSRSEEMFKHIIKAMQLRGSIPAIDGASPDALAAAREEHSPSPPAATAASAAADMQDDLQQQRASSSDVLIMQESATQQPPLALIVPQSRGSMGLSGERGSHDGGRGGLRMVSVTVGAPVRAPGAGILTQGPSTATNLRWEPVADVSSSDDDEGMAIAAEDVIGDSELSSQCGSMTESQGSEGQADEAKDKVAPVQLAHQDSGRRRRTLFGVGRTGGASGALRQMPSSFGLRHTPSTFGLRHTASTWGLRALGNTVPRVRIQIVTYNMNSKTPKDPPEVMFLHRDKEPSPDIYVIGTQESGNIKEWKDRLQDVLGHGYVRMASHSLMQISLVVFVRKILKHRCGHVHKDAVATGVGNMLGNKGGVAITFKFDETKLLFITSHFAAHEKMLAQRNADFHRINRMLFAQKQARPLLGSMSFRNVPGGVPKSRVPGTSRVAPLESSSTTDIGESAFASAAEGPAGAKVGSIISRAPSSGAALIAAHYPESSSSKGLQEPIPEHRAVKSVGFHSSSAARAVSTAGNQVAPLPGTPPQQRKEEESLASERADVVFWFGDFNYRVVCHRLLVESALAEKQLTLLQQADQLMQEMKKGSVFQGFSEGPISFHPSYKYNPGTDTFDSSAKQRTPSWTDRILWKTNNHLPANAVQLLQYTSLPEMKMSDHKPVVADFTLTLKSSESMGHSSQVFKDGLKQGLCCFGF